MSQLLSIFVNVLTPVFTIVAVGYLAGPRLGVGGRSLSKIAYYILAPAFIFNLFSAAAISLSLAVRMSLFIIVVTSGCVLAAMLSARLMGHRGKMVSAFILLAAFGNAGNFGLPIIQFKLGEEGLLPASIYFLTLSAFGFIVGVMAAAWDRGGAKKAVWSTLTTPAIVAVLPAALVNGMDWTVPLFLDRSIDLLSAALIPVMLLTLGMQLGGIHRPRLNANVAAAGFVRLIVGPLLAIALAGVFGLSGLPRDAGIIQASMPSAVFCSLIALEYDLAPEFVTTTVLFSTLASALTLTAVLAML
ncbi:MAG: AEC family transporter [Chloroflexota bacterium]|nr:AEC family transporter [Chloroflexota bacterium]